MVIMGLSGNPVGSLGQPRGLGTLGTDLMD